MKLIPLNLIISIKVKAANIHLLLKRNKTKPKIIKLSVEEKHLYGILFYKARKLEFAEPFSQGQGNIILFLIALHFSSL